jgi:hypothetical protein
MVEGSVVSVFRVEEYGCVRFLKNTGPIYYNSWHLLPKTVILLFTAVRIRNLALFTKY